MFLACVDPLSGCKSWKKWRIIEKKSPSILFFNAKTLYFRLLYNIVAMQKLHWAWKIEILHNPGHCVIVYARVSFVRYRVRQGKVLNLGTGKVWILLNLAVRNRKLINLIKITYDYSLGGLKNPNQTKLQTKNIFGKLSLLKISTL